MQSRQEQFWNEKLSRLEAINFYQEQSTGQQWKENTMSLPLTNNTIEQIIKVCKNNDFLIYVFFFSVFECFARKNSRQGSITAGTPIYRESSISNGVKKILPISCIVDGMKTFKEVLNETRLDLITSYKYQNEDIAGLTSDEFLDEVSQKYIIYMDGLHKEEDYSSFIHSEKNSLIMAIEKKDSIDVRLTFNEAKFEQSSIEQMVESLNYMIEQIAEDLNILVKNIEISTTEKRKLVVQQFNQKYQDENFYSVIEQFEVMVRKVPENIVLMTAEGTITYAEMNQKAECVKAYLQQNGVKVNDVVAVILDYSVELVAAILGVLKAGAAYLPIDVNYAKNRIEYMLENSNASCVLSTKNVIQQLGKKDQAIDVNMINWNAVVQEDQKPVIEEGNLAYIVYTSGTSGKPKGVMVTHRGLSNLFQWRNKAYEMEQTDVVLQLLSVSFDGFGTNLYSALLTGGKIILPDSKMRGDFQYIRNLITEQGVTCFSTIPIFYHAILENAKSEELKSLRFVVLAGDRTSVDTIRLSKEKCPGVQIINEYGPTENTIVSTSCIGLEEEKANCIGKPIKNCHIYIMNQDLNLAGIYTPGELFIAGKGLSNGYIGIPNINNEKFIDISISERTEKMYRTGDIGYWDKEGNLFFLGRADNQIKISGYRIELEEIEQNMLEYENIKEAVVVCKNAGKENASLCAYFVADKKEEPDKITEFLHTILPDYMVPNRFIQLNTLPKNMNGKIDRRVLVDREEEFISSYSFVEPEGEMEIFIASLFKEVLHLERVGSKDAFFALGGNSILLMKLYEKINETYPDVLSLVDLFSYATIQKLAHLIEFRISGKNQHNLIIEGMEALEELLSNDLVKNGYDQLEAVIPQKSMQLLKILAKKKSVTVDEIMAGLGTYLFSKFCTDKANSYVYVNETDEVLYKIVLELDKIKAQENLIYLIQKLELGVCDKFDIGSKEYEIQVKKKQNRIVVIWETKKGNTSSDFLFYSDIYLSLIEVDEEAYVQCKYNSNRISEDKLTELLDLLIKFLEEFVSNEDI